MGGNAWTSRLLQQYDKVIPVSCAKSSLLFVLSVLPVRRGRRLLSTLEEPIRHLPAFSPPGTNLFESHRGHEALKMFGRHVARIQDARQWELSPMSVSFCEFVRGPRINAQLQIEVPPAGVSCERVGASDLRKALDC